jgi:hypothetical protein
MIITDDELKGEDTIVHFEELEDALSAGDLLELFIRFAFAAGYVPESVDDAIVQKAYEIEPLIKEVKK